MPWSARPVGKRLRPDERVVEPPRGAKIHLRLAPFAAHRPEPREKKTQRRIVEPARGAEGQIEQAAREAQAEEFIQTFEAGYQTEIGERGVTLSGGQRQRVAIARAFLSDPRILILDDSTSAIDSATEDQIQRAMRRISRQRTTFLITHRLSQIRWADRILVLRRGELVTQGTHEQLMRNSPDYRRIFDRFGQSNGDGRAPASATGDSGFAMDE